MFLPVYKQLTDNCYFIDCILSCFWHTVLSLSKHQLI